MLSGGATLTRCRQRRSALAIMLSNLLSKSYGNVSKNATQNRSETLFLRGNRVAI